jgi:exo-1,4-beta-D-glucosaminidase
MRSFLGLYVAALLLAVGQLWAQQPAQGPAGARVNLQEGWQLQSSAKIVQKGDVLSSEGFEATGWYPTSVPSTVLGALVANKVYPDPYVGMNLRSIPGTSYRIGTNFSNLPMPAESPFAKSWWYRKEFRIPEEFTGQEIWLHFDGINFRANIWLNGRLVAGAEQVAGAWRIYEFNVTGMVKRGQTNALAVEVFAPKNDDLAITFVDWNPLPADKEMGLWRDVYLTASGPVALRWPQVVAHFDSPSLDVAHLTVNAQLRNATGRKVRGTLRGEIGEIAFSQTVQLAPMESREVTFSPEKFPQLNVRNPRVWWPAQLGAQNLYTLKMRFEAGGRVSDQQTVQFGIREITSELTDKNFRLFKVNGKKILIRGAGWTFDLLLRADPQRQEAEIRYVKDMNLNTIRFEGKLADEHFLATCDREGILVLAGWCCCDHWERWKDWKPEDYTISAESLKDQIYRLRNHPCLLDWLNGSDNPPPARVEETYVNILKQCHWPNPYQSSATAKLTSVTGKTGLKMTGPYEYVAPSYWLLDKNRGGAHGFNTETSPGPAVPPIESLRQFIPEDKLWPINAVWDFHAGGGEFKNLKVFTAALNARYGEAKSLEDYVEKSQLMTYEGERAMFEAYGRNKYVSTGVIQWMLNNAWPALIWHLYDYYLRPAGGYFGAKKACEPLHIQYSYDDGSVVVVNLVDTPLKGAIARTKVYNLDLADKLSVEKTLDVPPDSVTRVLTIPPIAGLSTTYFLDLRLEDASGKLVSHNFYWLSTKPEVSDWENSKWYFTPIKSYADFTALQGLPKVSVKVSSETGQKGGQGTTRVKVENPSSQLAFFVHLKLIKGEGGEEVLPILWEDNYISLLPGETREITATYRLEDLAGAAPVAVVDGWNVLPQ